MTRKQLADARDEVKELVKGSEWEYESSDVMDGMVYVTVWRPLTEEEENADDE